MNGAVTSGTRLVDVGGHRVSVTTEGRGSPTVVFESGGGNDGSVWTEIAAAVRDRAGVQTFVYDRAGLGASDPAPLPYSIENDAQSLIAALNAAGVDGEVILVAHSYGGYIATIAANRGLPLAGLVLVDAGIPGDMDDAAVQRTLATYRPRYDAVREQAPHLAGRMIPMMEAYPETIELVNSLEIPRGVPLTDIVADDAWRGPEDQALSERAHHALISAAPDERSRVVAGGSGHNVMADRPDVVIDAIVRMVAAVRGLPQSSS